MSRTFPINIWQVWQVSTRYGDPVVNNNTILCAGIHKDYINESLIDLPTGAWVHATKPTFWKFVDLDCNQSFVGQAERSILRRFTEHMMAIWLSDYPCSDGRGRVPPSRGTSILLCGHNNSLILL